MLLRGVKIGLRPLTGDDPIAEAVAAAAHADAAVLVVGTNAQWESEGSDRESMDLPGEQDELVRRVAAANPNTVVVVNTASPVTMDWADDVGAIVQAWFGGQEMGDALADVLFGDAEPSGRLPTTIPLRVEHSPSYGNFPTENGEVRYGEGIFVGIAGTAPLAAGALPVRARLVVHHLHHRRAGVVGSERRGGQHGHRLRDRHQHGRASWRRGGAVLRRGAARRRSCGRRRS